MKKISSGEISASTVTNGISTRKPARKTNENNEEEENDPYGLLEFNDEESLQELVSVFFFINNNISF